MEIDDEIVEIAYDWMWITDTFTEALKWWNPPIYTHQSLHYKKIEEIWITKIMHALRILT